MAFVNYNNKEITVKIVYYGPALSGKTTCLKYIYNSSEFSNKGKLITLDTDGDRTLFFDFLPLEIGKLGDYSIKIQLYTVPGQVAYDTTRKLVLQGADGVVFVADSQVVTREQNIESYANLKTNLEANNIAPNELPIIFQYNKRDLKEILPVDELNKDLNSENRTFFPTVATTGENIIESLHAIMKMVIMYLKNKLSIFQKDKTVMFSREEITSKSPKKSRETVEFRPPASPPEGDTEAEDVFELSEPLEEESGSAQGAGKSEDIFSLEDSNIISDPKEDTDDPEINVEDQLAGLGLEESGASPQESADRYRTVNVQRRLEVDGDGGDLHIPVEVSLPGDKDRITFNLKLNITVKKK